MSVILCYRTKDWNPFRKGGLPKFISIELLLLCSLEWFARGKILQSFEIGKRLTNLIEFVCFERGEYTFVCC